MGEVKLVISDELETRFRKEVIKRAIEDAIESWVGEKDKRWVHQKESKIEF